MAEDTSLSAIADLKTFIMKNPEVSPIMSQKRMGGRAPASNDSKPQTDDTPESVQGYASGLYNLNGGDVGEFDLQGVKDGLIENAIVQKDAAREAKLASAAEGKGQTLDARPTGDETFAEGTRIDEMVGAKEGEKGWYKGVQDAQKNREKKYVAGGKGGVPKTQMSDRDLKEVYGHSDEEIAAIRAHQGKIDAAQ